VRNIFFFSTHDSYEAKYNKPKKKDLKNERKPTIWTFKEQAEYNTQESKNFATL
jgi:hypothetical protein